MAAALIAAGYATRTRAAAHAFSQRTIRAEVVADDGDGVIRFVVDGREVARFESGGLYVRGDVEYGGRLVDIGPGRYENRINTREGAKP